MSETLLVMSAVVALLSIGLITMFAGTVNRSSLMTFVGFVFTNGAVFLIFKRLTGV